MIPVTLTSLLLKLQNYFPIHQQTKYITQLLFLGLLIASPIYAKGRNDKGFNNKSDRVYEELYGLEPILVGLWVAKNDLILAPFNPSPNITLCAMKRKGWTRMNSISAVEGIYKKQKLGAKWIIIPTDSLISNRYLHTAISEPTYQSEKISLFRLQELNRQN